METASRQKINIVIGRVSDSNGRPLAGLKVEIHDVDMRAWQLLADTVTDRKGMYQVHWSHEQLSGRGKGTADIAVKVLTLEKNTEIFRSSMDQVRFNAGKHEEINITVTQSVPQEQTEYEMLLKNISFLAGKVPLSELKEDKEHRDITFLSKELDVPAQKIEEVRQLFEEHRNDLATFFDKITDIRFFDKNKKAAGTKTSIALGRMVGFGNEVIPHLVRTRNIKKPADIRKLAGLNTAGWVKVIEKANPELRDKKLIGNYASAIVRKFEKEYPTMAFAAQLEREKKKVLKNQADIVTFLNNHEDLDLTKTNIDLYLKKKRVSRKNSEAVRDELKSVQRVFRLIPSYSKTLALRNEKIHSAQHIYAMGEARFVNEVAPRARLTQREAREVYRRAETRHMAAMLFAGDLQDSMSVVDIPAFETDSFALKLASVSEDFPNLKSLFKGVDMCECEHCRSVYSPAAYLVEILQFLEKRSVAAGNAKSVLFSRRPDIGEIDLSCANATTPVPYIDLVCELLEEAIASDQGIDYTGNLSDGPDPLTGQVSNNLLKTLTGAGLPVRPVLPVLRDLRVPMDLMVLMVLMAMPM